jgi:hypothetical protein
MATPQYICKMFYRSNIHFTSGNIHDGTNGIFRTKDIEYDAETYDHISNMCGKSSGRSEIRGRFMGTFT